MVWTSSGAYRKPGQPGRQPFVWAACGGPDVGTTASRTESRPKWLRAYDTSDAPPLLPVRQNPHAPGSGATGSDRVSWVHWIAGAGPQARWAEPASSPRAGGSPGGPPPTPTPARAVRRRRPPRGRPAPPEAGGP